MAATITTLQPTDFTNRLQKYFSRQLLLAAVYNLRLGSFGTAKELPANSAANTIRFFRPRRAKKGASVRAKDSSGRDDARSASFYPAAAGSRRDHQGSRLSQCG